MTKLEGTYNTTVHGLISDGSARCKKARRLIMEEREEIISVEYVADLGSLMTGDFFKVVFCNLS